MSINHFSSDLPEAHWWSHYTMDSSPAQPSSSSHPHKPIISTTHHNSTAPFWLSPHHHYPSSNAPPMFCNQNTTVSFDLNIEDDKEVVDEHVFHTLKESEQPENEIPKERLFEKPLTPSDVGKLNRLVIPKQHAEKHFPLNGGADSGENGLLLGFEDEVGKSWRFRYSYWNSSQSYVLTKGWSRFVKEKRLDAGDIVIFARHRVDTGRFFIGWRRRNSGGGQESGGTQPNTAAANGSGGGGWSRAFHTGHPYQSQQQRPSNSLSYQPESVHAGGVQNQTSSSSGSGNSKRLRLFGVNLECQADDSEPSTPVGSPQGQANRNPYHQQYYSSNHHMGISLSGAAAADVYRQG